MVVVAEVSWGWGLLLRLGGVGEVA